MKLAIGDRVQTPDGPGKVVGKVERPDSFDPKKKWTWCWSSPTRARTFASGEPTNWSGRERP